MLDELIFRMPTFSTWCSAGEGLTTAAATVGNLILSAFRTLRSYFTGSTPLSEQSHPLSSARVEQIPSAKPSSENWLDRLPPEVLHHVLGFCDRKFPAVLASVDKALRGRTDELMLQNVIPYFGQKNANHLEELDIRLIRGLFLSIFDARPFIFSVSDPWLMNLVKVPTDPSEKKKWLVKAENLVDREIQSEYCGALKSLNKIEIVTPWQNRTLLSVVCSCNDQMNSYENFRRCEVGKTPRFKHKFPRMKMMSSSDTCASIDRLVDTAVQIGTCEFNDKQFNVLLFHRLCNGKVRTYITISEIDKKPNFENSRHAYFRMEDLTDPDYLQITELHTTCDCQDHDDVGSDRLDDQIIIEIALEIARKKNLGVKVDNKRAHNYLPVLVNAGFTPLSFDAATKSWPNKERALEVRKQLEEFRAVTGNPQFPPCTQEYNLLGTEPASITKEAVMTVKNPNFKPKDGNNSVLTIKLDPKQIIDGL